MNLCSIFGLWIVGIIPTMEYYGIWRPGKGHSKVSTTQRHRFPPWVFSRLFFGVVVNLMREKMPLGHDTLPKYVLFSGHICSSNCDYLWSQKTREYTFSSNCRYVPILRGNYLQVIMITCILKSFILFHHFWEIVSASSYLHIMPQNPSKI